jgi:uncharacterized RDD family membrane protein YckC
MTGTTDTTAPDTTAPSRPKPLILLRLLSLFYDLWPMLAVWMLVSALFNAGYYFAGHGEREILETGSPLGVLLWLCCLLATGAYAVASWARGGQTLGMRPWRLRVAGIDGATPTRTQLVLRFLVGVPALLLGGLGFWWAWIDRDRLTWHDRASGTRVMRVVKR